MFERFTRGARANVKAAVARAERTGAASVTEEHLLIALLEQEGSRASFALAALGLDGRRAALDADFTEARRRGGLTRADTDALAGSGSTSAPSWTGSRGPMARALSTPVGAAAGGGPGTAPSPRGRRASWRSR